MTHGRRVATDTAFSVLGIGGLVVIFQLLGNLPLLSAALGSDAGSLWMLASFGASITLILACPRSLAPTLPLLATSDRR